MNDQPVNDPKSGDTESLTDPRVTSQLEALDDLIFPAIDGDQSALAAAVPAWKQAVATLGETAVQESRRQYLRHARATWVFLRNQTMQHPHQILAVLKIIMLLTGDDAS